MKILTNSDVKKPRDCRRWVYLNGLGLARSGKLLPALGLSSSFCSSRILHISCPPADMVDSPIPMAYNIVPVKKEVKKKTVRTFFPETWIWDLVSVG